MQTKKVLELRADDTACDPSGSRCAPSRGLEDADRPTAHPSPFLSQDEELLHKDEQLASRDEEIERLKLLIAKLRRMQFGRKSEKLDWQIEQLEALAAPDAKDFAEGNRVSGLRRRVEAIVQAEAPNRPIERGIAGSGLLAHVLTSKYADHLPLYRQAEIYAREGVELDRSTMAEWVGECSRLLEPLLEALRRHVMSTGKLHADDTPVPVLAPGNGKTKTRRLRT